MVWFECQKDGAGEIVKKLKLEAVARESCKTKYCTEISLEAVSL